MQLELLSAGFVNPDGLFPECKKGRADRAPYSRKGRTPAHSEHSPVTTEVHGDSCRGQVALVGPLNPQVFSGLGTLAMSVFTREGMPLAR